MEFDFMVVNLGVRYDYFDPNAKGPTDPGDPANPDKLKDAEVKNQFSPRLGMLPSNYTENSCHKLKGLCNR